MKVVLGYVLVGFKYKVSAPIMNCDLLWVLSYMNISNF